MNKESSNESKWITSGYGLFGDIGVMALNVEKLSNIVGLQRSSFYHYFGTMEAYEQALLNHHIERYKLIGDIIKDYLTIDDLFNDEVFAHQDALLFQRQLMINQSVSRYKQCSDDARKFTEEKTFELWSEFSETKDRTEEEWNLFRAVRDFYFINHGQQNVPQDPKEVIVMLHNYLKGSKK